MTWMKGEHCVGLKMATSYLIPHLFRVSNKGHDFSFSIWEGSSVIRLANKHDRKNDVTRVPRPKLYKAGCFPSCLLEHIWSLNSQVGSWVAWWENHGERPCDNLDRDGSSAEPTLLVSSWKSKAGVWGLLGSYKPGTSKLWPTEQLPDFANKILLKHNHSHLFTH